MRRNAQQTSTPSAVLSGRVSVDLAAISDHVRTLDPAEFGLRPALTVTAPVLLVKKVPAGTGVREYDLPTSYECPDYQDPEDGVPHVA